MPISQLRPNERYAFVGKTRSGKTALAMLLAGTWARSLPPPWEVWWIDTKGDPDDIRQLRKWGFRNAVSKKDRAPESGGLKNALYFKIESKDAGGIETNVADQAQAVFRLAYQRTHVIVVIDEYVQVVYSRVNAGADLLDIFQRGGGRKVGLIGLTQEPVYVPRQLISQATHVCLLSLTYVNDIKYVKNLNPAYQSPLKVGDPHGFWWSWVDGHGEWDYFPDQKAWYETVNISKQIAPDDGVKK